MSSEYPRPIPATVRWSRRIVCTRRPSSPSTTNRSNSLESASGPSFSSGPSSPSPSTHHPALRSRPNSFTNTEGRPSNRNRTTPPRGLVVFGGFSISARPPCDRCTSTRGPPSSNATYLPRRPTPVTDRPTSSDARGVTVFSEENCRTSAAWNVEPRTASASRSASACTSGSSGTPSPRGHRGRGAPDDLDAFVDPVAMRPVRQDARADREPAVDHRARQEHALARVDRLQEPAVRDVIAVAQPEGHDGQIGRPRQLQEGLRFQPVVERLGQIELLVERLTERRHTVEPQREPRAEPSAKFGMSASGARSCR